MGHFSLLLFQLKNDPHQNFVRHFLANIAKIARIKKFNEIRDSEREKAKKGLEKSANFAKNAKVTEKFPCLI